MQDLTVIAREIDLLEQLHEEISANALREDDRRRHDLVKLRRRLAGQMGEVQAVCEPLFTRMNESVLLESFRTRFSRMRHVTALHQAKWPAVLLDEHNEEYKTSAAAVREASQEFVAWIRATLAGAVRHT